MKVRYCDYIFYCSKTRSNGWVADESRYRLINGFYAIDYQVHSIRSHDGLATIDEQCEQALIIGLDEIGFTEHKDFDPEDPVVDHFDYAKYSDEIDSARQKFGDRLVIRKGVEIDYQKWFEEDIREYLAVHAFDYVLGSVHYTDRKMLMTDEYLVGRSMEEAYRTYYQSVLESVESGLIDIVGHLEYANRRGVPAFGPFDPTPYFDILTEIFVQMRNRDIVLEINTAGLRQGVGYTYPCEATIELFARCGGRIISIGSDSHHSRDLGADYAIAAELARKCGINDLALWDNRNMTIQPLTPAKELPL